MGVLAPPFLLRPHHVNHVLHGFFVNRSPRRAGGVFWRTRLHRLPGLGVTTLCPGRETIGFDYGQRHRIELDGRDPIARPLSQLRPDWATKLGPDHLLDLKLLGQISDTALTESRAIEMQKQRLTQHLCARPQPAVLNFAASVAYRRGLSVLVGGMCETDYSGYPDCRDNTLKALQVAMSLGLDTPMTVETPLMWLTKAQTWALTDAMGALRSTT